MTQRRAFLTCYDYGMGGVWQRIRAGSSKAITSLYPELTVYDDPPEPDWWAERRFLDEPRVLELEDLDDEFLASLRSQRRDPN